MRKTRSVAVAIVLAGFLTGCGTTNPWYLDINSPEDRAGVRGGVAQTYNIAGRNYTVIPDYTTGGVQAVVAH